MPTWEELQVRKDVGINDLSSSLEECLRPSGHSRNENFVVTQRFDIELTWRDHVGELGPTISLDPSLTRLCKLKWRRICECGCHSSVLLLHSGIFYDLMPF